MQADGHVIQICMYKVKKKCGSGKHATSNTDRAKVYCIVFAPDIIQIWINSCFMEVDVSEGNNKKLHLLLISKLRYAPCDVHCVFTSFNAAKATIGR